MEDKHENKRNQNYISEGENWWGKNIQKDRKNLNKISKNQVLSKEKQEKLVDKGIKEFRIKCFGPEHECNNLSGGNQQKVVLAKWIYTEPKILILDEPTRGVDIGAKKEIYSVINDLAAKGVAVILVSSELPEVLGMSDRIMVVREGEVRGILDGAEADQAKIMTLATGGSLWWRRIKKA